MCSLRFSSAPSSWSRRPIRFRNFYNSIFNSINKGVRFYLFYNFNYSIFFNGTPLQRIKILPAAMEHILNLKGGDGKKRFLDNLSALDKAFSLASSHEEALAIRDDLAFFQAVRVGFIKTTLPKGKRKEDIPGNGETRCFLPPPDRPRRNGSGEKGDRAPLQLILSK